MSPIVFYNPTEQHSQLLPLTYTKPCAELRVGILTIREKWSYYLGDAIGFFTEPYLQEKFGAPTSGSLVLVINGTVIPSAGLVAQIKQLNSGDVLMQGDFFIAGRLTTAPDEYVYSQANKKYYDGEVRRISFPWDIFRMNGDEIRSDYDLITKGRTSRGISDPHTITYGSEIFVEAGASVKAAILNAEDGPIYIGKNATIGEGAVIKGPFALCENSQISMGAKIRGDSTIGPFSKAGGEVSNSVIQGYSSKGHDGFLGNSVIGEWCNLGAGTNNSNLKNNYVNVKMWSFKDQRFMDTGLQFCGLIMGDHSKCGISSTFNTGTTVGVGANIFGAGFPRNFIPSFAWGGAQGFSTYQLNKMFETTALVTIRRNVEFSDQDKEMLAAIFDQTRSERVWDH